MLLYAIIFINAAFVLYTIGVLSEKFQGKLKLWHVIIFWLGVVNDTLGTLSMEAIIQQSTSTANQGGIHYQQLHASFHSATGAIALVLMLAHTAWATRVFIKRDVGMMTKFHHFSLFVWLVWLIPFITGATSHYRADFFIQGK